MNTKNNVEDTTVLENYEYFLNYEFKGENPIEENGIAFVGIASNRNDNKEENQDYDADEIKIENEASH